MSSTDGGTCPGDNLPCRELAFRQNEWLADARSRLLRRAGIARRKSILDLGAGWGQVSRELARRSGGQVLALDRNRAVLMGPGQQADHCLAAAADRIPVPDRAFDLIFCQCFLLWARPLEPVLREVDRLLQSGGVFTAIEPDYGGMMEYPREIALKSIWIRALRRAGADPYIGRKLPALLDALNFEVEVQFFDRLRPADEARIDLLLELTRTAAERRRIESVRRRPSAGTVVHLPFWMICAEKRSA